MREQGNDDLRSGLAFGLSATVLWGSYPLWYKPLAAIDSWQLLSWRVVFAELFLVLLLLVTSRTRSLRQAVRETPARNILIVASILGLWWFIYIYGIMTNRVLEVAMGYFISPIMSIAVSHLVFREKMSAAQRTAVGLASLGVALMALRSFSWASFPWIALSIGFCFSFYGIFKKRVPGDPVVMQTLEIMVLLPLAAAFLFWAFGAGRGHRFLVDYGTDALLLATGVITVFPLWWYSRAAKQLPMMVLGFLQFVPPSCNFLLAILVYKEPLDTYKLCVFSLIWVGLAIFMIDTVSKTRVSMQAKRLQAEQT
jgi:chloramphenicol-sensitive protein RarD